MIVLVLKIGGYEVLYPEHLNELTNCFSKAALGQNSSCIDEYFAIRRCYK